jgi:hypothetical protein
MLAGMRTTVASALPAPLGEAVRTGRLSLSGRGIEQGLRLMRWSPLALGGCEATTEGLGVSFTRTMLGAAFAYQVRLRITDLRLDDVSPFARLEIVSESLEGGNLLGRLLVRLVRPAGSPFARATGRIRSATGALAFRRLDDRRHEFDLGAVPALQQVLGLVPRAALPLLPRTRVEHVRDGLVVVFGGTA